MKKESDPLVDPHVAKLLGHRNQVVVMHPDDVIGRQQRCQVMSEQRIDALIAGKVAPAQLG